MATKKETGIDIRPLREEAVEFEIVGRTPLILHNFSEKARREMLEKQMKANGGKAKHEAKVPVNDFINSLYWLTPQPADGKDNDEAWANFEKAVAEGARWGFRVSGIKQSIIMGAMRAGLDVKGTELKGNLLIEGTAPGSTFDLAAIEGPAPTMREDMVRLAGPSRVADVRHRAEFATWRIPLRMTYDASGKYSIEQLLNCVNYGGRYCGIGEWRPDKDGQFGMYALAIS